MARFDPSLFGIVFDSISEQFEKATVREGEAILAAHLDAEHLVESRERLSKGGARVATEKSTGATDLPDTPAGRRFQARTTKRFEEASAGGAAPGLKGQPMTKLPPIKEPEKPTGKDRQRTLDADASAKVQAIQDWMSLGYTREEAEANYNRSRAKSDRPTG